jgi:hypothetical protein
MATINPAHRHILRSTGSANFPPMRIPPCVNASENPLTDWVTKIYRTATRHTIGERPAFAARFLSQLYMPIGSIVLVPCSSYVSTNVAEVSSQLQNLVDAHTKN